jgi:hypothetical protein
MDYDETQRHHAKMRNNNAWKAPARTKIEAWLVSQGGRLIAINMLSYDMHVHYALADGTEVQYEMLEGNCIEASSVIVKYPGQDWDAYFPEHR